MQRGVATALAILFSWLLILPAFAAPAVLNAAPCCRKGGSHQCAMHSSEGSTAGVRTIQAKCPFANGSLSVCSHFSSCAPANGDSVYAGLIQRAAVSIQTQASFRFSYDRSRQKRGPPLSILG
jgi:hypothetical protein